MVKTILLIIAIPTILYSQQIGWEEVYRDFGNGYTIRSLYQTADNGFIGVAVSNSNNVVFKVDSTGKLKKLVNYGPSITGLFNVFQPFVKTTGGNYLLAFRNSSGIKLVKLNEDLQEIWINSYPLSDYKFRSVNQTNSGDYVVITEGTDEILMIKFDNAGSFISDTTFNISTSSQIENYFIPLIKFPNGTFLFGGKNDIVKLDENGNYLWNEYIGYLHSAAATSSNEILVGTDFSILKLDSLGNSIWSEQTLHVYSIITLYNGNIVFAQGHQSTPAQLSCKDINGNDLWERNLNGRCFTILQNPDESLVLGGDYRVSSSYFAWGAMADADGLIKSITVWDPNGGEVLSAGETYNVQWLSSQAEFVDIEISSDNGNTWNEIVSNYPDSVRDFNWGISPDYISTDCLLKITSSSEPDLYDITDTTFTITHYQEYDYIAVNEIKMWIGNNGDGSHNPLTDAQGLFWPGGEHATQGAVFEDGLVFGGKVNGEIRVGGSTYRHGLRPGNVLSDTTAADYEDVRFQIWKIKKDTSMLSDSEKVKYEYNYNNWPVDLGAPWVDVDLDGIYTPGIDHPKFYGEETMFNVMNDFDSLSTLFLYGSNPMGLEVQCLTYGMNTRSQLMNAVFKQYKLINKSSNEITDMYLSYWCDDDLGEANDDYMGVDTTLNLGYTWNGTNDDWIYGSPPPAVGHMIIQGPIVPAAGSDSARFDDGWRHGYKNLPATAFSLYINISPTYGDPDLGFYQGTLQMYNNMKGLAWDGSSYVDPNTGEPTLFCIPGDPVAGTGWYDGDGWPGGPAPGDRRYLISSGPFNLAPGDTQEITIALLMALGSDNIQSVAVLRDEAAYLQEYYNNDLLVGIAPDVSPVVNYILEQNYPNPFNPVTNIEYAIPRKSRVTIKIYDILGREVQVFNQGEQPPMHYRVSFNASALASGVYFYRIEAVPVSGQGEYIQTKKMVLLK